MSVITKEIRLIQESLKEIDDFGNVLQTAAIAYGGRHASADEPLRLEDRAVQEKQLITYSCNQYTKPISAFTVRRNPMPADSKTFQLYPKNDNNLPKFRNSLLRSTDVRRILAATTDGRHDLPYSDFEGAGAQRDHFWRRLIEGKRSLYRADDLSCVLPLGTTGTRGVTYQTYAMTIPEDLGELFFVGSDKFKNKSQLDSALGELGYVRFHGESDWWEPSGKRFFSPGSMDTPSEEFAFAQNHFFLGWRYRDQYYTEKNKSEWFLSWDKYDLLPEQSL